jgi:outer membrane protein, multidrug efflux system
MALKAHAQRLVVAFLTASFTACATSKTLSTKPVQTPPALWSGTAEGMVSDSQDLSQWWDRLVDSILTGLIQRAVNASPDMRTAQSRLRQARAQRGIAAADLAPSVSGSATLSARNGGANGLTLGLDASWEPDIFGTLRRGVDAATADLMATAADLSATRTSLVAEVALNYIELRTFQARLEIARKNESTQAETLELTQFRAQAGLVSSVDVQQARTNLEQTRAQIPSLETSIAQTIHRLSTLAGREPSARHAELAVFRPQPEVPQQVAVGIPAETLRQRPDVRAAEQRVVAETLRIDQSRGARFPRFNLSGSIGTEILTRAGSEVVAGALTSGASLISSVAGSVVQTIFDRGRVRQQIEIQTAIQEQAVASYDATVLLALEDVENALVAFDKSRQRLRSLEAAEEAATNAALLASTRYEVGLTDFQTVLDTQRTLLSVQDSVAATEGDRLTALVQLYKALGGGWDPNAMVSLEKAKS